MGSIAKAKKGKSLRPATPWSARTRRICFTWAAVNASFCPTRRPLFQASRLTARLAIVFRSEFGHSGCAVHGRSVAHLTDFCAFQEGFGFKIRLGAVRTLVIRAGQPEP